jgi:hypothetical protein
VTPSEYVDLPRTGAQVLRLPDERAEAFLAEIAWLAEDCGTVACTKRGFVVRATRL